MIIGEEDKMNVGYYWASLQACVFFELKIQLYLIG
jgi:hypothetical protein